LAAVAEFAGAVAHGAVAVVLALVCRHKQSVRQVSKTQKRRLSCVLALTPEKTSEGDVDERRHHPVVEATGRRLAVRVQALVLAGAERGVGRPGLGVGRIVGLGIETPNLLANTV
jgi:hypothetical protein